MEIENAVEKAIADLGASFDRFKLKYNSRLEDEVKNREELERKLNRLQVGPIAGNPDSVNHDDRFQLALKGWYPGRAGHLTEFDYSEYKTGFSRYLRSGLESLPQHERKAMQVGIDADGGFLAPSEFSTEIIRVEHDNSVMRGVARIIQAGADMEFPATLTRPEVGWVGETGARAATDAPLIGKIAFVSKELYCMPEVTQKLLDDAALDIEQFIIEEIGLAMAEEEDGQFISGDGILKPRGFTTYPTAATSDAAGTRPWGSVQHIPSGVSGAWPAQDSAIYDLLVDTVTALRPAYRRQARWIMPTAAVAKLSKLKDSTGTPLWQRSLAAGQQATLLGYPVLESEQMPAIAANSLSVAFADWKRAYWIVDRFGIRILRDPYTNKPYVRFYATKRCTGGIADSSAIKLIKFAAA